MLAPSGIELVFSHPISYKSIVVTLVKLQDYSSARYCMSTSSSAAAHTHTQTLLSLIPGATTTVKADVDKLLTAVHQEDRVLVSNVIKTMQVLRNYDFLNNLEVVDNKKCYDVIGTLAKSFEKELIVTSADFEILQSVSVARVASVMVQVSGGSLELVVRVFKHDTAISFSTVQVSHISKKTRWL